MRQGAFYVNVDEEHIATFRYDDDAYDFAKRSYGHAHVFDRNLKLIAEYNKGELVKHTISPEKDLSV